MMSSTALALSNLITKPSALTAVPFDLGMPRTPERAYLALARVMVMQALDTVLASPTSHGNPVGVSFARSNASQASKRVPPELICQMNPPVPTAFVSSPPTPALG